MKFATEYVKKIENLMVRKIIEPFKKTPKNG